MYRSVGSEESRSSDGSAARSTAGSLLRCLAVLALLVGSASCSGGGNGEEGDNGGDPPLDTGGGGESDTSAGDVDPDASDADDGDGEAVPDSHCGVSVTDLGSLAVGASGEKEGTFGGASDGTPDCASETDSAGASVYAFRVEEGGVFRAEVSGRANAPVEPAVEIHSGDCGESREIALCASGGEKRAYLEPGTTYFAWVHGSSDVAEPHYILRYGLEAPACTPGDHPSCSSGTRTRCPEASTLREYACAGDCASESSTCAGDTCSSAPSLDLSSGTVNVRADRLAYEGDWSAEGRSSCAVNVSGGSFDSKGVEYFARLEGVASGDTVVFDSVGTGGEGSDSAKGTPVAFLILSGCGASQCTAAGLYDQNGENRFEWTASSAGPFYLVAEVLGSTAEDDAFEFDVSIQ